MYSQEDIESAVRSGVLDKYSAERLRTHVARMRQIVSADEEATRLVHSFNDVFVAIAIVIVLIALGFIGQAIGSEVADDVFLATYKLYGGTETFYVAHTLYYTAMYLAVGGLLIAITSWSLSEIFTRRRRMALPSVLLSTSFTLAAFAVTFGVGGLLAWQQIDDSAFAFAGAANLLAAIAAWLHWKRFEVPITIALITLGITGTIIGFVASTLSLLHLEHATVVTPFLIALSGVAVFLFAMVWDTSDRRRITRRSDVAFWLHLLAAPMIAHPLFYYMGITSGQADIGLTQALAVLGVYTVFGLIALAVDRRALLVSALAYVLITLGKLFDNFGSVELNFALIALVIGSALLTLSTFWTSLRRALLKKLPLIMQAQLPDPAPPR